MGNRIRIMCPIHLEQKLVSLYYNGYTKPAKSEYHSASIRTNFLYCPTCEKVYEFKVQMVNP